MKVENSPALQSFLKVNLKTNLAQLAFKKTLVKGFENRFVLNQLNGKQKAKNKLPYLFENNDILYPSKVSVEQSSSEKTAIWKANLVSGDSLLDMTGGFGVDTFHFAKNIKQVTYLEQNEDLFAISKHNFNALKADNIIPIEGDSLDFLQKTPTLFDWIYLDPARRDEAGGRKIGLAAYFPNLLEISDLLFSKTQNVLVKVSPMLDIQQAIQQLGTIQKVIVLAVQNEVKELLFILNKVRLQKSTPITYQCVDLRKDGTQHVYKSTAKKTIQEVTYAYPKTYVYEPNAAILKAGLFKEVALDFGLDKLHPNTHLYTSDELITDFPGRTFICTAVENFNKKAINAHLENKKANITTRNFPYSVAQIKKKLATKDGGNLYLFAATLKDEKLKILVCEKKNTSTQKNKL